MTAAQVRREALLFVAFKLVLVMRFILLVLVAFAILPFALTGLLVALAVLLGLTAHAFAPAVLAWRDL